MLGLQKDTSNQAKVNASINTVATFILDYIQTAQKEWNWTKRERLFLWSIAVGGRSFHLACLLLSERALLPQSPYKTCNLETSFTWTGVKVPLTKSVCCCLVPSKAARWCALASWRIYKNPCWLCSYNLAHLQHGWMWVQNWASQGHWAILDKTLW